MKVLVKMIFGSHLYGTNTEKSDMDYKGIYLPSIEDCVLDKVQKTYNESTSNDRVKNTVQDVDYELYSLQHFIKLACAGETVAIDMLHTPDKLLIEKTPVWESMQSNRSMFYSKNMNAFIGYARSQAKRYSVKGERLQLAEDCLKCLETYPEMDKLKKYFVYLVSLGALLTERDRFGNKFIDINGRLFSETVNVKYTKEKIKEIIKDYGHRAQKAKEAGGIDWKAISHAVRVTLEIEEIIKTRNLVFPLKEKEFVLDIKQGRHTIEQVMAWLDEKIYFVEQETMKSDLPEKVNMKYWEDFIVRQYK